MKIYDIVLKLLIDRLELRSSDRKLLWAVWEYQGIAGSTITKQQFLDTTISAESITRARRKAQELHPELEANDVVKNARVVKQQSKGTWIFREETNTYYLKPSK